MKKIFLAVAALALTGCATGDLTDGNDPEKLPAVGVAKTVQIVEFSDFGCGHCAAVQPKLEELFTKFSGQINFVFRDFPNRLDGNPELAHSVAGCTIDAGGDFWTVKSAIFNFQNDWLKMTPDRAGEFLREIGINAGADPDSLAACIENGDRISEIRADRADGIALGVTGTPTFFIAGEKVVGNQPLEIFIEKIDAALAVE